jgi:molybdopterin-containing oxidoreductase family iron-sulfur binding subunit
VQFAPDASVWDGRHANNSWLQELPHPLTKLVWDNSGLIAPATATALGLATGDVVEIRAGDRSLQVPVSLLPGQAADTITLPLGYGRRAAGRVGTGVGFDANAFRRAVSPWLETGVEIVPTGIRHDFVTTQDHHRLESQDIVRVVEAGRVAEGAAPEPRPSFYPDREYAGHAWGMAIDLDACIGCNACVVACQAENNVPVVGREEVGRGREMHWLRIDRYYSGEIDEARTLFQPVLCMHCEKAPCEVVCPVNATVHSSDGLNDMVYNRCIGTRTCSNNCPYKVRRFNWFDYSQHESAPRNPDVSVRPRGVMEKCTYCVQRIRAAEASASLEGRAIGQDLQTACQQACPTRAIVFGDINDPESAVSEAKASLRNYALLGELDTRPRTTYLARLAAAKEPAE